MAENTLAAAETLAVSGKSTLVVERLAEGKIRLTSTSLVDDKVILPRQILEICSIDGRIRVARKERLPDAGDPPRIQSDYDPYGPGTTDPDILLEPAGTDPAAEPTEGAADVAQ